MKKTLVTILFIALFYNLFADIPTGYYNNATGSGYTLKTQLHNIIKTGHTAQGYGDLYDAYVLGDTDPEDGYVWDMYSENPDGADPYNYEHYNNNCGTYSTEGDCLNREHLFPQGIFNEASPMKTDYHHVVPSDGKVNGMRSSYPFGEVGSASWTSLNGSKKGSCSYLGYTGTVFEPIDEFKGDIARCMLYFATRYEDKVASWSHTMLNGTSDQVYADWFISMLVDWHIQDPVDAKDNMRNEAGYDFQGNRNPFIDHPEYVTQIWGGGGNMIPSISNVTINPEYPTSSDNVNIFAEITDNDGTIESSELHWGVSSGSLSNTIALTNTVGNTYKTSTPIPAQADGTIIYFEIEAVDDEPESKISSEQSYEVCDNPTITILNEDFFSCPASGWTSYSFASNEDWSCTDGSMEINAYGSDAACNDWLISPAIDLDSYSKEILTFTSWTKYTDSYNPPVELKYSTNYSGSGDPSGSTWTNLSAVWPSQDSQVITGSGNIDLSSISGSSIYIAVKYISSGTGGGSSVWWKIDDFIITGKNAASGNDLPLISDVLINPEDPTATEDVTISATITDSDGTISSADLKWGTTSGSYTNTISMTNSGDDYSSVIPMQSNGTEVYFIIDAFDNETGNKQTPEYNYTVNDLPVISDIEINPENPTATENVTVSATITDPDGSISSADLRWGTTSGSYTNTISMTNSGDIYFGEIPMQSHGTKVYFIIEASDNEAENKQTSEYEYTVNDLPHISNIEINPEIPASTENITVSATISDSDGTISNANIKWGTSIGSYPYTVSMSNSGDEFSAEIPMQTNGISIFFVIQATDNETGSKQSSEHSYTVNYLPAISNVLLTPENPTDNDIVIISATITDSDGSISSANLKWGTDSESTTNSVSMSSSGNTYSGEIPVQSAGTEIYFLIEATDNLTEQKEYNNSFSITETTGIIEFTDNNLKIYPNPVKENLNIEFSNGEIIQTIEFFNVLGEKVFKVSGVNSSEFKLNLESFAKGIYFIKIDDSNSNFIKKIILK